MEKTHHLENGKNLSVFANFDFYTNKESDEAYNILNDLKPDMIISSIYDNSTTPLYSKIISRLSGCMTIPYTIAYAMATKRSTKQFTIFDYDRTIPQEKIEIRKKESILENIITPAVFGIHNLVLFPVAYPLHKYAGDHLSNEFYEKKGRPVTKRIARGIVSLPYEFERLLRKDEFLEDMYRPLIEKSAEVLKNDDNKIQNLLLVINNIRDFGVIENLIEDEFSNYLKIDNSIEKSDKK
ncbi:hypothetical protein GQ472_06495 [archaeon]|nr:hypothetical protein [archaeon]